MTDTNYISSIVKILETPVKTILDSTILTTRFSVKFPQSRNDTILTAVIWGNLAEEVEKYYKINDYILIEGYISFYDKKLTNSEIKNFKTIEVTVLKIYPFLYKF